MKIETKEIEIKKLNITGVCSYIDQELCTINIRHYLTDDIAISFIIYGLAGIVMFTDINGEICTINNFCETSKIYGSKYSTMKDYIEGEDFKEILREFFGCGVTIKIICSYNDLSEYMQVYTDYRDAK